MNESTAFLLACLPAYLTGCFPSGYLISKFILGFDVTKTGSGNIGMTNVVRTGGVKAGLGTLALDWGKGAAVVFAFAALFPEAPPEAVLGVGLCAVLGHTRNVFLKFKGGKGIATHFGIWSIFEPTLFLAMAGAWLAVFLLSRISSLSALTMLLLLTILAGFTYGAGPVLWMVLAEVSYLFFLHRENIHRLLKGEEKKLTSKSASSH